MDEWKNKENETVPPLSCIEVLSTYNIKFKDTEHKDKSITFNALSWEKITFYHFYNCDVFCL